MIPVSLYGADEAELERFYSVLPQLVDDAYEDRPYQETLFAIIGEDVIEHIEVADSWASQTPFVWPEELVIEVEMTLQTVKYPDVGLLEHLLTLENVDCCRLSTLRQISIQFTPKKHVLVLRRWGFQLHSYQMISHHMACTYTDLKD